MLTPTDLYLLKNILSIIFVSHRLPLSLSLSLSYSSLLSLLEREDRNRWFYLLKPVKKGTVVNGSGSQKIVTHSRPLGLRMTLRLKIHLQYQHIYFFTQFQLSILSHIYFFENFKIQFARAFVLLDNTNLQ